MQIPTYGTIHTAMILTLCAVVAILGFLLMVGYLQPKGRVSCLDFGSYDDANRAFSTGKAPWLDHDNDGIPCETLYKRDYPNSTYGE